MPHRFTRRFTLPTLFVTVSLFALAVGVYCFQLPPAEVRQLQLGMTFDEMVAELGFPNAGGNADTGAKTGTTPIPGAASASPSPPTSAAKTSSTPTPAAPTGIAPNQTAASNQRNDRACNGDFDMAAQMAERLDGATAL